MKSKRWMCVVLTLLMVLNCFAGNIGIIFARAEDPKTQASTASDVHDLAVSNSSPTLGETITLSCIIDAPEGKELASVQWDIATGTGKGMGTSAYVYDDYSQFVLRYYYTTDFFGEYRFKYILVYYADMSSTLYYDPDMITEGILPFDADEYVEMDMSAAKAVVEGEDTQAPVFDVDSLTITNLTDATRTLPMLGDTIEISINVSDDTQISSSYNEFQYEIDGATMGLPPQYDAMGGRIFIQLPIKKIGTYKLVEFSCTDAANKMTMLVNSQCGIATDLINGADSTTTTVSADLSSFDFTVERPEDDAAPIVHLDTLAVSDTKVARMEESFETTITIDEDYVIDNISIQCTYNDKMGTAGGMEYDPERDVYYDLVTPTYYGYHRLYSILVQDASGNVVYLVDQSLENYDWDNGTGPFYLQDDFVQYIQYVDLSGTTVEVGARDMSTGIYAFGEGMEEDAALNVNEMEKGGEVYESVLNDELSVVGYYELDMTGTYINEESDTVRVDFPIDAEDGSAVQIDHMLSDGSIQTVNTTVQDGVASIVVREFSPFLVQADVPEVVDPYDYRNRNDLPVIEEPENYINISYTVEDNDAYWRFETTGAQYPAYKVRLDQLKELVTNMVFRNGITITGGSPKGEDLEWFNEVCSTFSSLFIGYVNEAEPFEFTISKVSDDVSSYFIDANGGSNIIVHSSERPIDLNASQAQVQIEGDVGYLYLNQSDTNASVTISGNVDHMLWYLPGTAYVNNYQGSLTVGGTLAHGDVFSATRIPIDERIGITKPVYLDMASNAFIDVSGLIIEEGEAKVLPVAQSMAEITGYEYMVDSPYEDKSLARWYLVVRTGFTSTYLTLYDAGEPDIDRNYYPDFTPDKIISGDNVSVHISDTDYLPQGETLVISADVPDVYVHSGRVEVTGNVRTINADGSWYDVNQVHPELDLTISGNVDYLLINGRCKHMNITMSPKAVVSNGSRIYPYCMGMGVRSFSNITAAETLILMDDSTLLIPTYSDSDNFGLILPSMEEVGSAVGVGDEEFASVVISNSLGLSEAEEAALREAVGDDSHIVAVINMDVNKYTEGGEYLSSVSELDEPVDIQYDFDTAGNLTAIDLHNNNGDIEAAVVGQADSGETLTITTDKFSSFVILSDKEEDMPILPEEPQYYMFYGENDARAAIEKSQFTRTLWSGFALNSIETPNGTMLYIDEIKKNGSATIVSLTEEPTGRILDNLMNSFVGFEETEDGLEIILIPGLTIVDRTDNQYISSTVLVDNPYTDDVVLTFETDANIWILGDMPLYPVFPTQDEILTIGTYEMTMTQVPSNVVIAAGTYKVKTTIDEQGNYTLILLADYQIIEGANGTWDEADETAEEGLLIRSDAPYADFVRVEMDGEIVDPSNYDVSEGSTIVIFHKDFLEKLPEGKHTVSIISKNGSATTAINIVQKAEEKEDTTPDDPTTPNESKPSDDGSKPSEESGKPNNSSKPEESKTEEAKPTENQPAESKPAENSSSTTETKEPAPVTSNKPDTGDRANTTAWAMCLLISMVGMLVVGKYGKKRTN